MDSTEKLKNEDDNSNFESGTSCEILTETKLYKRRWAMAAMLAAQSIVGRILMTSIGVINDIYKTYFDLSSYVVDWFTLIQIPAIVLSAFLLAILTFNSITDSRKLFILFCSSALFLCACSLVAITANNLYGLIFVGQFVVGFGVPAASAVIGSLAINWFPENQIGYALSIKEAGFNIGCLLGYLIPSQIFIPYVPPQNIVGNSLDNELNS